MTVEPSAARLLRGLLDDQVARAQAADGAVGPDLDGAQPMYVGFRRLSTTLTVFRPLLQSSVDPLNDEARWFLAELRPLRDIDLVRARVAAAVSAGAVPDPGSASVQRLLEELRGAALERATQAWTSERYAGLTAALRRLYGTTVIRPEAQEPARAALRAVARRELRRLRTRAELAQAAPAADRDERLDAVRRATRRVRHAGTLLGQADAPTAARLQRRLRKLPKLLGDRRDTMISRACLEGLRDRRLDRAGDALVDRLLGQEATATARIDRKLPAVLSRAVTLDRLLEED